MSSGGLDIWGVGIKVTASDFAETGPYVHIFFGSGITGTCRNAIKILWRLEGGWGLELNFLGYQIEENFWEAKL